ncbi:S41 family peptidase [Paraglaciecola aquimarina]|uniref:S41 family peptidase n=1 Tax=Paraglaciecola aquimarina TaxID=1235557 RepID=A0ABU3SUH8_9ALTE|nr:S41 family peptidase [Paraglaciecola aquimarina]MDU0353659.1 S41 family peptidase [Paraglaciecola aquimarina]
MSNFLALLITFFLLLSSCHRTIKSPAPKYAALPQLSKNLAVCESEEQQIEVYWGYVKQWFYWRHALPDTMPDADNIESLIAQIKDYARQDKWTQVNPLSHYQQLIQGHSYKSLGLKVGLSEDKSALVVLDIFSDSAARSSSRESIARGDNIIFVNDRQIAHWLATDKQGLQAIFSSLPDTTNAQVTLEWLDQQGNLHRGQFTPSTIRPSSIRASQTLTLNDQTVGYLAYDSFDLPSITELNRLFVAFKKQQVKELIVDLRYNGGGTASVANHLASLIAGSQVQGKVFNRKSHNPSKAYGDISTEFLTLASNSTLNLTRLFVLTTQRTASASELLINSLKPFIQVITIGQTTAGKPIGMQVSQLCQQVFFTSTHLNVNAEGQGHFFNGIPPTCEVQDQAQYAYGDKDDPFVQKVQNYISNNSCDRQNQSQE